MEEDGDIDVISSIDGSIINEIESKIKPKPNYKETYGEGDIEFRINGGDIEPTPSETQLAYINEQYNTLKLTEISRLNVLIREALNKIMDDVVVKDYIKRNHDVKDINHVNIKDVVSYAYSKGTSESADIMKKYRELVVRNRNALSKDMSVWMTISQVGIYAHVILESLRGLNLSGDDLKTMMNLYARWKILPHDVNSMKGVPLRITQMLREVEIWNKEQSLVRATNKWVDVEEEWFANGLPMIAALWSRLTIRAPNDEQGEIVGEDENVMEDL